MNTVQNGKGSRPRNCGNRQFWDNFDQIDWGDKGKFIDISLKIPTQDGTAIRKTIIIRVPVEGEDLTQDDQNLVTDLKMAIYKQLKLME